MSNPELFAGITSHSPEDITSHFPEGARVHREGDVAYVYDASGKRRWFIHDFVMEWEKKRHLSLELQAETSGGTWHLLMGVYQARDADTDAEIDTGVTVDVITGQTDHIGDVTTPNRNIQFSAARDGVFFEGWGGGYYGRREDIEGDLEGYHALAKSPDELPRKIDVYGTVQRLAQTFWEGKFEPPQFVVPTSHTENPTPRITSSLSAIYRRLRGRSGGSDLVKR